MSQSDDDDYVVYGTPLEPLEDDELPRKKPIAIEDQVVTDKQGRRRFHGAFTGGFSAGFYNSVGSLEGWKPSNFKSSRSDRSKSVVQRPEDFMDDEDTDEFGIAPNVLKARPEYSRSNNKKRERINFQEGPIPGEPVLKSILEPNRDTVGVFLLMKMGWKPGQGIGPRLSRLEKKYMKKRLRNKPKVYGCCRGPQENDQQTSDLSDDSNVSDEDLDTTTLFAPDEVETIRLQLKEDMAGIGYKGLDRNTIATNVVIPQIFKMRDQHNKKISISGQAFGVGAFEEEDDDIYSTEDMSNYDFSLETKSSRKKRGNDERATSDSFDAIPGFVAAKTVVKKKYFSAPDLPPGFKAIHSIRKSKFDSSQPTGTAILPTIRLNAESRATIFQETVRVKEEPVEEDGPADTCVEKSIAAGPALPGASWRPFASDALKQERYEKFLHYVKIGAKDAFSRIQPFTMTDWERERELSEFESAARLYTPLKGVLGEKFTHSCEGTASEPLLPKSGVAEAAASKMYGKLTRETIEWSPHSLVCKRFNIQEPNSSGTSSLKKTLEETKKKPKFSIFEFLEASKNSSVSKLFEKDNSREEFQDDVLDIKGEPDDTTTQNVLNNDDSHKTDDTGSRVLDENAALSRMEQPSTNREDGLLNVESKMDLFKAIFESSDESEDEDKIEKLQEKEIPREEAKSVANALRNTSPPRGIFANIDLDNLNKQFSGEKAIEEKTSDLESILKQTEPPQLIYSHSENKEKEEATAHTKVLVEEQNILPPDAYGPLPPSTPVYVIPKTNQKHKLEFDDDLWVEKKDSTQRKRKKDKKKKKDKHKHKKKKKKKYSDSD